MLDWRTILVGLVVATFGLAAVIGNTYLRSNTRSELVLVNRSSEAIENARMRQGSNTLTLEKIAPGETRSVEFDSNEGPVSVGVTFRSGTFMSSGSVGHLVASFPVIVSVDVTNDAVLLRSIRKRGRQLAH